MDLSIPATCCNRTSDRIQGPSFSLAALPCCLYTLPSRSPPPLRLLPLQQDLRLPAAGWGPLERRGRG